MNANQGQSARKIANDFSHLHSGFAQVPPGGVYQNYLLAVRQLARAAGASLLVEPKAENQHRLLLTHEGSIDPIPELASEEAAVAAIAAIDHGGIGCRSDGRSSISGQQSIIRYYPSEADDGCLLRIRIGLTPWQASAESSLPAEGERRNFGKGEETAEIDETVWIGLRYGSTPLFADLARLRDPGTEEPQTPAEWLAHILVLGAIGAWETCQLSWLLRDSISELPGQTEFQARLKSAFLTAGQSGSPLGLLLINPDEFGVINQRLD
ncbi:MAG: hypothetical protein O7F73_18620, partial [Gammaproteobacteria bacterium]|nr:hypothetical protein [Gammaproteobacteria bacterium]